MVQITNVDEDFVFATVVAVPIERYEYRFGAKSRTSIGTNFVHSRKEGIN
jgi:hypothetical protein